MGWHWGTPRRDVKLEVHWAHVAFKGGERDQFGSHPVRRMYGVSLSDKWFLGVMKFHPAETYWQSMLPTSTDDVSPAPTIEVRNAG